LVGIEKGTCDFALNEVGALRRARKKASGKKGAPRVVPFQSNLSGWKKRSKDKKIGGVLFRTS